MSASLTNSTDARLPSCVGGRPAPASAGLPPAGAGQSLSVPGERGVASCANHKRAACARQQVPKNDCSQKTNLEQLFGRSGPISQRSISRSGSAAANAGRNTSSTASGAASSLRARFTSSKAKCSIELSGVRYPCAAALDAKLVSAPRSDRRSDPEGGSVNLGERRTGNPPETLQVSAELQERVTGRRDGHEFSSGGGLGIHEPGSNTRGPASRPSPSGRARDRVICPAVARSFFSRGAA